MSNRPAFSSSTGTTSANSVKSASSAIKVAAGCSVVVKAHSGHMATADFVAQAI
nr:hypothetical protein [Acinetobacter baumannii]